MDLSTAWPVPFFIDPQNLAMDATISFVVSILLTITINAEAQAFMAVFLGDHRPGAKDRFHFNAFLHLDILGSICYLVGGFGWPRTVVIDPDKFKHPRLYAFLTRLAGPMANFLLANIAGSLVYMMKIVDFDPRVFLMVLGVNVTTAVYNLLPLPPLAGGALIHALIPGAWTRVRWIFWQAGPFLLVAIALLERITQKGLISPYLNPLVNILLKYITG
jgi:Zn-dependent protease